MAVTSLWRVKGDIGSVIRYAENPEKTLLKERGNSSSSDAKNDSSNLAGSDHDDALLSTPDQSQDALAAVLSYAARKDATEDKRLVSALNCSVTHAIQDMQAIKRVFGKEDGTIAYHGYQSFSEGEVTPKTAHEIGVKLAEEVWGDRYQVLIATHVDKASHIHNHFCINTVSFVDGKKFFRSKQDYLTMRSVSDRLCREYGLSVIKDPQEKGKHYAEWKAEKEGKPTYRSKIREDIDLVIRTSFTERDFFTRLTEMGYEFKFYTKSGDLLERPSLKPPRSQRFFRFDKLGNSYSLDEITDRIYENRIPKPVFIDAGEREEFINYRKEHPPIIPPDLTGFAKLVLFFAYILGVIDKFPQIHPNYPRVTQEDRKAIIKLERYDEMVRLMCENKLKTVDDVIEFQRKAKEQIEEYSTMRTRLHAKIREYKPTPKPEENSESKNKDGRKDPAPQETSTAIPPDILQAEKAIREINEEIRRIRKLLRISNNLLEESERLHARAENFGIHKLPDGDFRLETPEEQLEAFDRKMEAFDRKLEQEKSERKVKNRNRNGNER